MIRTAEVFEDDYPEDEVGMNNTVTIYVEEEDVSEKKKSVDISSSFFMS